MNLLDIILIAVSFIFLVRGFMRGFVKEVFSLVSIGLAYLLASRYNHLLEPHLKLYIANETTVWALSTVLIFVGVLVVCWFLAKLLREFLELALLGWLDRTAGAVFGAAEGVLLALLALLLIQTNFPNASFVQKSTIAPHAQPALDILSDFEPSRLGEALDGINLPTAEDVKKKADEAADAIIGDNADGDQG